MRALFHHVKGRRVCRSGFLPFGRTERGQLTAQRLDSRPDERAVQAGFDAGEIPAPAVLSEVETGQTCSGWVLQWCVSSLSCGWVLREWALPVCCV